MHSIQKRKRSINFTPDEKMRFLRILQEKGNVILSKVTAHDLQTNKYKEEAWIQITNALNASGTISRSTEKLKKLWAKLKFEAKSYNCTARHHSMGTDVGHSKMLDDPVLELVAELTGRGCAGIDCTYDSDSLLSTNTSHELTQDSEGKDIDDKEVVSESVSEEIIVEPDYHNGNANNVAVSGVARHLKRRRLKNLNERNLKTSVEKEKLTLIALQKQHMIEEHNKNLEIADIKKEILETVLKKIRDENTLDSELLKVIKNI